MKTASAELCPVRTLLCYKKKVGVTEGQLLVNTKTKRPLKPATISHLICHLINEADPGKIPKAHDVRKISASLAWVRGLKVEDILKNVFWKNSSVFVRTYLVPIDNCRAVALGTE